MTRIEELANQILIEMEKIGANRPKIDIYAYDMPSLQLASEVAQKALGREPKNEDRWFETRKDRVSVIVFVKDS